MDYVGHYSTFALQSPLEGEQWQQPNRQADFRIEPRLKEALRATAEQEHRSIANMIEVMIQGHCRRNGVAIPEQGGSKTGTRSAGD